MVADAHEEGTNPQLGELGISDSVRTLVLRKKCCDFFFSPQKQTWESLVEEDKK